MKRTALIWAVVLMAVMGAAPMMLAWQTGGDATGGDPHSETQSPSADIRSNRADFGASCGIQDTSDQSALGFAMSGDGEWSALPAGGSPSGIDQATARVWHETNWMVDMHAALEPGMAAMHSGQMCFDPQGHITFMVDRFMETCMRLRARYVADLCHRWPGDAARESIRQYVYRRGIAAPEWPVISRCVGRAQAGAVAFSPLLKIANSSGASA